MLASMTNRELSEKYRASRDAAVLTEDDEALATEYRRGAQAIGIVARMRGYDLETGRHEPKNATDPKFAYQHTDGDPDPIRVVQKNRDRVITRS